MSKRKQAVVLFCGAGGSTFEIEQAGYTTIGADSWEVAVATHRANGFRTVRVDLTKVTVTTHSARQWIGRKGDVELRVSVTQAAKLQGFPKDYIFTGNIGDQYAQVGNAVPPVMAKILVEANQ